MGQREFREKGGAYLPRTKLERAGAAVAAQEQGLGKHRADKVSSPQVQLCWGLAGWIRMALVGVLQYLPKFGYMKVLVIL